MNDLRSQAAPVERSVHRGKSFDPVGKCETAARKCGIRVLQDREQHRWVTSDRVAVALAHRAGDDFDKLAEIDQAVEAATLAEPLRNGSKRNGNALLAAHVRLGTKGATELRSHIEAGNAHGHLPIVQGFVWRARGILGLPIGHISWAVNF